MRRVTREKHSLASMFDDESPSERREHCVILDLVGKVEQGSEPSKDVAQSFNGDV